MNLHVLRKTRIEIPRLQQKILQRYRLFDLLDSHSDCSLICINAGLGYGKTVLLADYFRRNERTCAWLTCNSDIRSASLFFLSIVSSLKSVVPGFGDNAIEYLNTFENTSAEDFLSVFINDVYNSLNDEVTFVLDDFFTLEDSGARIYIYDFLNGLLKDLPPQLKLIISSRYLPPLKIDKLKAKRNYFEFSNELLLVNNEELKDVSKIIYERELSDEETERVQKLCCGWFTPIHLLLQNNKIELQKEIDPSAISDDINGYLTEDLFDLLDPDIVEFLMRTAHLKSFSPEICDLTTKSENSAKFINELFQKNLFLERIGESEFSYQKLFVEFLLMKQRQYYSTKEIESLFRGSCTVLVREKRFKHAIDLYIEIQDYSSVLKIVYENFHKMVSDGYQVYCCEISSLLWEKLTEKTDELKFLYAYMLSKFQSDHKTAGQILSEYDSDSRYHDLVLKNRIMLLQSEIRVQNGEYESSIVVLRSLLATVVENDILLEVYHQLGRAYFRKGSEFYTEAIDLLEDLIDSKPEILTDERSANIFNLLGIIHFEIGKFVAATHYFEKVMKLSRDVSKWYKAAGNLVIALSYAAKYEKARSIILELEELVLKLPVRPVKYAIYKAKECFCKSTGDFTSAIKFTLELLNENENAANKRLVWSNNYAISESYFYLQELVASEQFLQKCESYSSNQSNISTLLTGYLRDRIKNNTGKEDKLLEILEYHRVSGGVQFAAIFSFSLGREYIEMGNPKIALMHLSSALKTARELSYKYFLLNEIPISRIAFDFAIANNIEKKFVFSLYEEFRERANLAWLSDEAKARLALDSERLTDIRFKPFGRTEFYLRGEKINEDKWIRKKSKVLLAYLMSDPDRVHTKDIILDMFFDDIPQEKADTMYHSTVYNIRTALKIYAGAGSGEKRSKSKSTDINPQYVVYEDKTLRLNPDFYYISENAEFEKYCSKAVAPGSEEHRIGFAIKAADLYRGDFMPGYYDDWCEELRVKYKNLFIDICTELIGMLEKNNRPEEVVKYAAMLINEDKLNDDAYIKMIKAYSSLGSKAMAVSCYNTMLKNYEEELGEKPHPKSLAEIKSILDL